MNNQEKYTCSDSYKQDLKNEIIFRSDYIKYIKSEYVPQVFTMVIIAAGISVGAELMYSNADAAIRTASWGTSALLLGITYFLFGDVMRLAFKDHSETHRLAASFRAEKLAKRNYCLESLKKSHISKNAMPKKYHGSQWVNHE